MKCKMCGWSNPRKEDMSVHKEICKKCYESGEGLKMCPLCGHRVALCDGFDTWSYSLKIYCVCGLEYNYNKTDNFYYMSKEEKGKFRRAALNKNKKHWNNRP